MIVIARHANIVEVYNDPPATLHASRWTPPASAASVSGRVYTWFGAFEVANVVRRAELWKPVPGHPRKSRIEKGWVVA